MHRTLPRALAMAAIALIAAAPAALAASPPGTLAGCVNKRSGVLRILSGNRRCTGRERSVTLLASGASGPAGPQGANGAQGPQGPQGPPGSDAQFNGAAAGGDLTGSFPNPLIAPDAIGSAEVGDNALTGGDIDESSLATVPDAADLGGRVATDYPRPFTSNWLNAANASAMRWGQYLFDTTSSGTAEYKFGGILEIDRTGTANQFKVCGNDTLPGNGFVMPYVVYVGATRTAGVINADGDCTTAFTVATGDDFQVYGGGVHVFGSPNANVSTTNPVAKWTLTGLGQ